MRISTTLAVATSLMVFAETQAQAQSGSLFGNNGLSSRGASSSGLSGNSGGSGSQSGGGSSANNITGFTGQTAGSGSGFTSLGASDFVGGSQNGFAGNQAASSSTSGQSGIGGAGGSVGGIRGAGLRAQTFGRSTQRGGGGRGFGQNGFGMNGNQGFNTGSSDTPRVVRPQQRIAFEYTPRSQSQVQASVATQFTQLQGVQFQGVAVAMDAEGVVTLTGTVPTEDARKLAAVLARIEPGVRSVSNNLVVETP